MNKLPKVFILRGSYIALFTDHLTDNFYSVKRATVGFKFIYLNNYTSSKRFWKTAGTINLIYPVPKLFMYYFCRRLNGHLNTLLFRGSSRTAVKPLDIRFSVHNFLSKLVTRTLLQIFPTVNKICSLRQRLPRTRKTVGIRRDDDKQ